MLIELKDLSPAVSLSVTENQQMRRHTTDGTDLMALQALSCQPNVLIQCDVGPRPPDGCLMGTPEWLKAWLSEQCAITGQMIAATTKMIFKSRTVAATLFTSLRGRPRAICDIVATALVSRRSRPQHQIAGAMNGCLRKYTFLIENANKFHVNVKP